MSTGWYRDGAANAEKGSKAVTGSKTYWLTAGLHAGDMLTFDDGQTFTEIAAVNSDTSLTLKTEYKGTTKKNAAYAVVRNFTATMPAELAADVTDLVGEFRTHIDNETKTLTGKSAYEVAKDNGFTGTEAQWLETLKAALATDTEMEEVIADVFGTGDGTHEGIIE